jgi:hypothetical protein
MYYERERKKRIVYIAQIKRREEKTGLIFDKKEKGVLVQLETIKRR